MNNANIFLYLYFIGINFIGSFLFILDKINAIKQRHRIKEKHLHLIELCGGIFSMFLLIFTINHKSKKTSYYLISLIILIVWLLIFFYFYYNFFYVIS